MIFSMGVEAPDSPWRGAEETCTSTHVAPAFTFRQLQHPYALAASLLLCALALITGCCVGRDILLCSVNRILAYA